MDISRDVATQRRGHATVAGASEPGWGAVLRTSVARAALATLAGLLLWSVLPVALGWTPRLILSGSMEPRVHVGDVILTRAVPADAPAKGHVVTVEDPDHPGRTRTHRVLRRDADGLLVLKGDANRQADSARVRGEDVLGVGVLRVPFVGRPAYWLAEGSWPALGATLAALGWCAVSAFPGRRSRRRDAGNDAGDGGSDGGGARGDTGGSGSVGGLRRPVVTAVTTAVLLAGAVAGPAQAAFRVTTSNPTSSLLAASTFYPYRTAVLADTPHLYWRLDETSGTSVDDAGTGNRDGTLVPGVSAWGQGGALASEVRGKALSLTSAMVNRNASVTAPTTFSLEAWVRSTSTTGGRILGMGNATGSTWSTTVDRQLYLAPNGKVTFGIGTGTGRRTIQSAAALNDGGWHHVVGTFTNGSNNMRLYVDKVLQGTSTPTPVSFSGYWRAGAEQMSGWTGNPTSSYLEADLDELAVYTKVLTATRVSAHYDAGRTP